MSDPLLCNMLDVVLVQIQGLQILDAEKRNDSQRDCCSFNQEATIACLKNGSCEILVRKRGKGSLFNEFDLNLTYQRPLDLAVYLSLC